MKFLRKSISVKISGLYIFLAIINMSFFTIIIYENQIDLIVENTKYHIIELTNSIISSLDKLGSEIKPQNGNTVSREKVVKEITSLIGRMTDSFSIFSEEGEIIYRSSDNFKFSRNDILNGIKAVTNRDFTGKRYYSVVDRDKYEISFYIPFSMHTLEQSILFINFQMKDIDTRLKQLYKLVIFIIILVSLFHIVFALMLFRIFVKPVKSLHETSEAISNGDLSARSAVSQDDEIGDLAKAFNSMAESVEEKILTLKEQYEILEAELDMASKVQEIIFPDIVNNDRFDFSVYTKPVDKVSGDYYDIFDLGDSSYGFLIVDVQGHGLPAAMITMIIKEKFRLYTPKYSDPAALIKLINNEVVEIIEDMDKESALFFTAFYLIIDKNNIVYSVDAGHICPFLIRKDRKRIELLKSGGIPIGISKEMDNMYITFQTKVEKGDKIVLYTDGIIEARNADRKQYGMGGIIKSLKKDFREPADSLLKSIVRDLAAFTNINILKDDATLFVIELK
ncbi:MAG TPA: SpoIIE family protein phosphatase [Spirochaetota bacterium]|nr:SpoIIE family protein phosphatase [Spirochaetota bacterium]